MGAEVPERLDWRMPEDVEQNASQERASPVDVEIEVSLTLPWDYSSRTG